MSEPSEPTLSPGLSRETTIRRDALGQWFHDGDPVTNPAVARAFDRWIDVADDGRYCLRNSANWAYVTIEGPPLFVRRARIEGAALRLLLSDDREEALDPGTLRQDGEGRLYATARGGRLTAAFTRAALLDLVDLVDEDELGIHLRLGAARLRPPVVPDPLRPAPAAAAHGAR